MKLNISNICPCYSCLQLSLDDISQYGHPYGDANDTTPFANLKFALESANSTTVLPEVDTENSLVEFFKNNVNGKLVEVKSEGTVLSFCLPCSR